MNLLKKTFFPLVMASSLALIFFGSYSIPQEVVEKSVTSGPDEYRFCHRCGMAVGKSNHVMTVTGVPEEPWYQCSPMCALMDIIECGKGDGRITAYCDGSGRKIEIAIAKRQVKETRPEGVILLIGGSCLKNKTFCSMEHALEFIRKTAWAEEKMLKTLPEALVMLKKRKPFERCSMCATEMKGHERTWFTIMTRDEERMAACCGHCGLFMMYKLKDKALRAVTPDFRTGRLIDAKRALYVAGNNKVICCFPSTISFEKKGDAEDFRKQHGGEILTFQQAMANIKKIMK
ncbi:nitrous oxide reductase accessory protein NosL [Acidobacteriota bacterium]